MATPAKDADKVFDVSKPGKTASDPTARPVIVGHGPILQDPMVAKTASKPDLESVTAHPDGFTPSRDRIEISKASDIEPSAEIEAAVHKDTVSTESTTQLTEDVADNTSEKAETASEEQAEKPTSDSSNGSDAAVVDAVVDQASAKKKSDQISDEELAKQAAIEKLVVDKTYFLKIGQVRRKRNNRRVLMTLVLLIIFAIVGGDLAIDGGLIKSNIKLPITILHKQKS